MMSTVLVRIDFLRIGLIINGLFHYKHEGI